MSAVAAWALLRRFWWVIPILALAAALIVTRGNLADAKVALAAEQTAHRLTEANYRAAAATRKASDLSNVKRVDTEQDAITKETIDDYQTRIADLRADFADRVRRAQAGANPGSPGGTNLPGTGATPSRTDEAAAHPKLPIEDALIASEQAEQLVALQAWVKAQAAVDFGGELAGRPD